MLTSITPLGERGRNRRWALTTFWYRLGSTRGGAAIGAVAGALAAALDQASPASNVLLALAAAACLIAALWDMRGINPPSWRRQVDEQWLDRYRGWVIGAGFGAQLGFGVLTIVTSASVYAMLLLGVLTSSFWGGLAVGATFGLVRALPLLAAHRVHAQQALLALHRRVSAAALPVRRVTIALLAAAAVGLAVAAALD
jgi:sulfite exporter TauE/SafE